MGLKEELKELRKRVKEEFFFKVSQKETKEKEDSDYYRLNQAIDQLIQKNIDLENELEKQEKKPSSFSVNLEEKVNAFIGWYFDNMVQKRYTEVGEYYKPIELRNFIEKMAVWYELRYPSYEINRLLPGSAQELKMVDIEMFQKNPYILELSSEDSLMKELEWDQFYNAQVFFESLSSKEKMIFQKPHFSSVIHFNTYQQENVRFHITKNGVIDQAKGMEEYTSSQIKARDVIGKTLLETYALFQEKGVEIPQNGEFMSVIQKQQKWEYQQKELFNCVMYRLIERGGNRIGPRRAFLFAKEFHCNIDIPMMYGIDYSDPGLRGFINEYLKAGGREDLTCYVDYFTQRIYEKGYEKTTIQEILSHLKRHFTKEEKELHQKLTSILASGVSEEKIKKQKVIEFRWNHKLEQRRRERN